MKIDRAAVKRVVCRFALAQVVLLLVPLLLSVLRIQDTLTLEVRSKQDYSVQVGYVNPATNRQVRQYAICPQGFGVKCLYLPATDSRRDYLAFGICDMKGPCSLDRVVFRKWFVVPFVLERTSLLTDYELVGAARLKESQDALELSVDGDFYFVPRSGMPGHWKLALDRRMALGFVGLEVLLLLCVCAGVFLCKPTSYTWRCRLLQAFEVAVVFSVFLVLVLPVQSYLANRVSFPYAVGDLLKELVVDVLGCCVVLTLALACLRRALGGFVLTALFGLLVYFYLATGILAAGLPTLDGDFRFFSDNKTRQVVDLCICAGCIGGCAVVAKWVLPYLHWCVLGFLVMAGASLCDVHVEKKAVKNESFATTGCSVEELTESGFFSSKGNVLVLVPDSVSTEMTREVFGEDASIREAFAGFTFYTNNVGMHNITPLGLPGLITGDYLDDLRNLKEHQAAVAGVRSCLAPYAQNGHPVFATMDLSPNFKWTNRLKNARVADAAGQSDGNVLYRRINDLQAWNLFEIVRFRLTPFRFKYQMAFLTMKDWPMFDRGSSEKRLYPRIGSYPVRDDKVALHVYHTEGSHFPFQIGKHGERLPEPLQTYEGMYNKTFFVYVNLAKLFAELRRQGVYDKTLIIVAADHGSNLTRQTLPEPDGYHFEASKPFPVLLVKPIGETGKLLCSETPTSHSKVAELVRQARVDPMRFSATKISTLLETLERLYRDFDPRTLERLDCRFGRTWSDASVTKSR